MVIRTWNMGHTNNREKSKEGKSERVAAAVQYERSHARRGGERRGVAEGEQGGGSLGWIGMREKLERGRGWPMHRTGTANVWGGRDTVSKSNEKIACREKRGDVWLQL